MKRMLLVLVLLAGTAYAQFDVNVRPTVSAKTIATINTVSGNDTIWDAGKAFDSLTVGMGVFGPGVPQGATITALVDAALDSALVLSDTCNATASVSLQFGLVAGTLYTTGDWLGFPFKVLNGGGSAGPAYNLISASIIDAADVITATDIVFYGDVSKLSGGSGYDNSAAAELAANEWYVLGIVSLTTVTDLGAVKILTKDAINLALPRGVPVWARMIVRGAPTFTASNNLRVRLRFQ
jgi:hypothetical protein